jgi:hypothetical protein
MRPAFTRISTLGVEEQRVNVPADVTSPTERWRGLGDADTRITVFSREHATLVPAGALFGRMMTGTSSRWLPAVSSCGRSSCSGDRSGLPPLPRASLSATVSSSSPAIASSRERAWSPDSEMNLIYLNGLFHLLLFSWGGLLTQSENNDGEYGS